MEDSAIASGRQTEETMADSEQMHRISFGNNLNDASQPSLHRRWAEDQIERVRQVEETPSRIKENEKEVETKEGAY